MSWEVNGRSKRGHGLPKAMSISRSEIFRKKKKKRGTEVEKIIGDNKRSMGCHGRLMGGQRTSLGVKF